MWFTWSSLQCIDLNVSRMELVCVCSSTVSTYYYLVYLDYKNDRFKSIKITPLIAFKFHSIKMHCSEFLFRHIGVTSIKEQKKNLTSMTFYELSYFRINLAAKFPLHCHLLLKVILNIYLLGIINLYAK